MSNFMQIAMVVFNMGWWSAVKREGENEYTEIITNFVNDPLLIVHLLICSEALSNW